MDFFAADFLAVDFFAGEDFFAVLFFAADLLAVDFFAADFFAGDDFVAVDLRAGAVALATVARGSFLAPETTAFSSAPALNFGTAVFFARIRSPVLGLRTMRAARALFSNEPNPVMATFSPLATSRVMVSSTDSRAWAAALRLPS